MLPHFLRCSSIAAILYSKILRSILRSPPRSLLCSLVTQGEELSPGLGDARNAGDYGDTQALPPERPLRDAGEIPLFHQILVSESKRAPCEE